MLLCRLSRVTFPQPTVSLNKHSCRWSFLSISVIPGFVLLNGNDCFQLQLVNKYGRACASATIKRGEDLDHWELELYRKAIGWGSISGLRCWRNLSVGSGPLSSVYNTTPILNPLWNSICLIFSAYSDQLITVFMITMRGFLYLSAPHFFLTAAPEVHWMQLPSIRAGKCVWLQSEVVREHLPSYTCRRPLVSLWCCSAVLLGLGELRLEPVLGGEETVPSQHRDDSHDLRSLPLAHKTQHRRSQGKKSTFRLDTLVVSASFRAFVAPLLIAIMKAVCGLFTSSVVLTTVWLLNIVSELSM